VTTGPTLQRIGDVLKLERRMVDIDPLTTYELIGVYSFGKGIFHREPVMGADLGAYRFFQIKNDDLVLSNIQAWEGAIAIAGPEEDGCLGTHRFMTYTPVDERADTSYLRYFFLSERGMDLIRTASPGSTARNRTLGIEAFESLEIPLPRIDVQRQIASRLHAVHSKAQTAKSRQSITAEGVAALITALAARTDLSDEQKEEYGWQRYALGEFLSQSDSDETVNPDGTYQIAGVYSFGRGLIDRGTIGGVDTKYRSLTRLEEDDIVISRLGGWEGAVTVVPKQFAGAYVSAEYPVFTPDPAILDPSYFAGIARSPRLWDAIAGSTRGSMARRKRIKVEHFLSVEVWLPRLTEQNRIALLINKTSVAEGLLQQSRNLTASLGPAALNEAFANLA
jgi:type I restriction enzyme, S subunit